VIAAGLVRTRPEGSEVAFNLRDVLSRARPLLDELPLLWHRDVRTRLVLFVRADENGAIDVSARLREHDFDPGGPELARRVRRVRDDVPVVVEVPGTRPLVLRWGSLHGATTPDDVIVAGKRSG